MGDYSLTSFDLSSGGVLFGCAHTIQQARETGCDVIGRDATWSLQLEYAMALPLLLQHFSRHLTHVRSRDHRVRIDLESKFPIALGLTCQSTEIIPPST